MADSGTLLSPTTEDTVMRQAAERDERQLITARIATKLAQGKRQRGVLCNAIKAARDPSSTAFNPEVAPMDAPLHHRDERRHEVALPRYDLRYRIVYSRVFCQTVFEALEPPS